MNTNKRIIAFIALLSATLIWGSSFVVVKDILDKFSPLWVVFLRFILSAIFLSLIFFPKLKAINKDYLWRGAVLGILYMAGMLIQTYGIKLSTPGKSAFITAAQCVFVPFVCWWLMKKHPTIKNLIAAVLCMVGIGFVSLTEAFSVSRGDFLTLLCAIVFAFHIVSLEIFVKQYDIILLCILQYGFGSVLSLTFAIPLQTPPIFDSPSIIWQTLYLCIVCTAIALLFQCYSQKFLSAQTVSLVMTSEAVFGALFSAILYGEIFSRRNIIGFILIFIAVLLNELNFGFSGSSKDGAKFISN